MRNLHVLIICKRGRPDHLQCIVCLFALWAATQQRQGRSKSKAAKEEEERKKYANDLWLFLKNMWNDMLDIEVLAFFQEIQSTSRCSTFFYNSLSPQMCARATRASWNTLFLHSTNCKSSYICCANEFREIKFRYILMVASMYSILLLTKEK